MPALATVTLIARAGCHLCDEARPVVTAVVAEIEGVTLTELSIDDDPQLREAYAEEIPVVLINDRVHNIWRIDADRLRNALKEITQ